MRRSPAAARRVDLLGEQDAVGREREVVETGLGGQHAHQRGKVAPQQRLAAGEPHPIDAEGEEHVDERRDLLEVQHVFARQPVVVVLGHAVRAAQVAPVGDRQAEVAQGTAEEIGEAGGHDCLIMTDGADEGGIASRGKNGREAIWPSNCGLQRPGTGRGARRAAAVGRDAVITNVVAEPRDERLVA